MTSTKLTRNAFNASRKFIETHARPLEIACFHHAFDAGPVSAVLDALKSFQNADSGFGHALEPDLRAIESSALCTSVAFQILRSVHADPSDALITGGISFFQQTMDKQELHWRSIPAAAQQSPHAPWWDQVGRDQDFDSFSLNPTAEILGYLYDYLTGSDRSPLLSVSQRVLSLLSGLHTIEMHDLLCCLRLLQAKSLPDEVARPVQQNVSRLIDTALSYDPAQWKEYGLRPLQVADSPNSPYLAGREQAVEENLAYEISSQAADGSWPITWSWGGAYPDDWVRSSRDWSGILVLEKLLLLKRFHRIEGLD